ncbi:TIGR03087 family PEP-CTERM/XrtA system glycosyltransferase [Aurantiacibacter sp. MUD11]|uniref:TIGR03087 family PEP-CTERM/XrtA system glycosyltransferase n=1 Tax=Aurantiacibacter sp. MUD11 TaxID=3003265 RepID=UPI0022AA7037|nr:TIGR03087 family PEP-CTERM/XrtA system glycosyltransferase [Aurantiacibacter sp. MUD11]WAT18498.1 TIGR03087 family PEP-CTERM/XrtA system glycosyltransferase [Aurantiacibacter sp. MUD11]
MNGDILFLAHRLPFPPDRGDRIRSHHVLKALAQIAPVHVGCFVDREEDRAHVRDLDRVTGSHCAVLRDKPVALAGLEALLRREPVSLSAFRSGKLARWVENLLASDRIGAIYVFSGQMGQFVPQHWSGRLIVDLVDVDSAKFEAYGAAGQGPRSWIDRREGRLLGLVEADLARRADRTLLVSEAEAALLCARVGKVDGIEALRNGIDCDAFDPARVAPHPELVGTPGPHIVFTGQMDYAPNVAAVQRFAVNVMPSLRERFAEATFHIVGRAPTAEVLALGKADGVRVWGEVPDVKPFLAAADLVTAPLTIARGVQNKVLEAMAMERCVLLSPEAATGIETTHGEHYAIAASDNEMIAEAIELLARAQDRAIIGKAARRFVQQEMSWPAMLSRLPEIVLGDDANGGCRDAA